MNLKRGFIFLTLMSLAACSQSATNPDPLQGSTEVQQVTVTPEVTVTPGDYNQTITVDGNVREYILHVPQGYDGSKSLPLVFVLHGHGGTAKGMVKQTRMNEKADHEGFVVAYLQGTLGADGLPAWNSGVTPNNITVDDVAFVRNLALQLKSELNVDSGRIYAAGFSNGGIMSHRLATDLQDVLAGVAVVESTIGISTDQGATFNTIPQAKGPIPVLIINGKNDTTFPYDGGQGAKPESWAKSVAEAVAFWTAADTCSGTPQVETSTDGNVITEDYTGCASGSEVELITIVSGTHQWPQLENNAQFQGTDAIWEFFSRHSKAD